MATWFTVYSPKPLRHITPADVASFLTGPMLDWHTLAEGFGIDDEAVIDRAVEALSIGPAAGELGEWFEVRYRPVRYRPLVAYLWDDAARVREELTEAAGYLDGRRGRGVGRARAVLGRVTQVAAIELGIGQLADMGLVIAGQVAEYLAGVGGGVIRDTGDEWWAVRRGVPKLLVGRVE